MWPPLRDGLVQNLSGDLGHAEIGQNEGIAAFGKHGEGFTAISGRVRVMTEARQEIHQEVTDLRVVVDDQDAMGQAASPPSRRRPCGHPSPCNWFIQRFQYRSITGAELRG